MNSNTTNLKTVNDFIKWATNEYRNTPITLELENVSHQKAVSKKRSVSRKARKTRSESRQVKNKTQSESRQVKNKTRSESRQVKNKTRKNTSSVSTFPDTTGGALGNASSNAARGNAASNAARGNAASNAASGNNANTGASSAAAVGSNAARGNAASNAASGNNSSLAINKTYDYKFEIKDYNKLYAPGGNWKVTRFTKSFEMILDYSLYICNIVKTPSNNHKHFDLISYINNEIKLCKEHPDTFGMSLQKSANEYRISKKQKEKLYTKYLAPTFATYTDDYISNFMKLKGSVYINDFHGGPIIDGNTFFKVPKNTKILLHAPINSVGLITYTEKILLNILANSNLLEGITKYGSEYMNGFKNSKIPLQYSNTTLYTENQSVPDLYLGFGFYIYNGPEDKLKDIDNNDQYYHYNDVNDFTSYTYQKLADFIIEKNESFIKENLYIKKDNIHEYVNCIIGNINIYDSETSNRLNNYVKNKKFDNPELQKHINTFLTIIKSEKFDIISKWNSETKILRVNFECKLSQYIELLNTKLNEQKHGNIYIFTSCRLYKNIKNINTTAHHASSFIYNYINTYISNIQIRKKGSIVDETKKHEMPYISISSIHTVCLPRNLNKLEHISRDPSLAFNLLIPTLNKDFLIIIAISYVLVFNNENFLYQSLYGLFIKPDIYSVNPEDKQHIINNYLSKINNAIKYKKPFDGKTQQNNFRLDLYKYLYKYYPKHCLWIFNNKQCYLFTDYKIKSRDIKLDYTVNVYMFKHCWPEAYNLLKKAINEK